MAWLGRLGGISPWRVSISTLSESAKLADDSGTMLTGFEVIKISVSTAKQKVNNRDEWPKFIVHRTL